MKRIKRFVYGITLDDAIDNLHEGKSSFSLEDSLKQVKNLSEEQKNVYKRAGVDLTKLKIFTLDIDVSKAAETGNVFLIN